MLRLHVINDLGQLVTWPIWAHRTELGGSWIQLSDSEDHAEFD